MSGKRNKDDDAVGKISAGVVFIEGEPSGFFVEGTIPASASSQDHESLFEGMDFVASAIDACVGDRRPGSWSGFGNGRWSTRRGLPN